MEIKLVIMGIVLLMMGYLVGVKKKVWLLAGYNQKRVADKRKLAHLVGTTFALVGVGLVLCGFFVVNKTETVMMIAIVIILIEIVYVNIKMVD